MHEYHVSVRAQIAKSVEHQTFDLRLHGSSAFSGVTFFSPVSHMCLLLTQFIIAQFIRISHTQNLIHIIYPSMIHQVYELAHHICWSGDMRDVSVLGQSFFFSKFYVRVMVVVRILIFFSVLD